MQPRIVLDGAPPAEGRRVLHAVNAEVLRTGMQRATLFGTAAGRIDPTLLAGKTGTAENAQGDPHAWFVGFAPAASPRLVVAVLVEHGGSGARVAASIAESIVRVVIDT